jgi:isocitrate/isopropylmalate dehydrogenase
MLEYLGWRAQADRLEAAITRVYAEGRILTPDQGGASSTTDFCAAVKEYVLNS